jgi:myo-inositol-1(or 4)-monophosphatase
MELEKILEGVRDVCKEVGYFIRQEGLNFDLARVEQKGSFNNLVSYVDKEAERKLVKQLHLLFPEAGFITEEGTASTSKHHEYNWIIDPLDGTTNFLHGFPIFSISVGLAKKEDVMLGVVYEVNHDECFYAIQGGAAYCNERVIRTSPIASLNESLLATGFPYYHSEKKDTYLDIIKSFLENTHGIRRLGSAAIDLAYVACGRLEGYFEYNLNPWDVAAGTFIVKQAGGKVSDFRGGNNFLHGREMCASCSGIHTEMVKLISSHWYPEG